MGVQERVSWLILLVLLIFPIVAFVSEFIIDDCNLSVAENISINKGRNAAGWSNPAYAFHPCRHTRRAQLLGLTLQVSYAPIARICE